MKKEQVTKQDLKEIVELIYYFIQSVKYSIFTYILYLLLVQGKIINSVLLPIIELSIFFSGIIILFYVVNIIFTFAIIKKKYGLNGFIEEIVEFL